MPDPVAARPAATVLLLRDAPEPAPGRDPLQVFLQRRVAGMAFAGGMTVFPGGGVDAADRAGGGGWAGPEPREWARLLACPEDLAAALVRAAVRETFEECGVLLAGPAPDPAALHAARAELVARRTTMAEVLDGAGLVLRADLLRPWARWVTPEESPRRYDTAFFVAVVPEGQEADAHTTEALEAAWWHPADALDRWQAGELELMAPTFRTLQQIAEHPDAAGAFAAAAGRAVTPTVPRVRREGEQVVIVVPGDDGFEVAAGHLRPGGPG